MHTAVVFGGKAAGPPHGQARRAFRTGGQGKTAGRYSACGLARAGAGSGGRRRRGLPLLVAVGIGGQRRAERKCAVIADAHPRMPRNQVVQPFGIGCPPPGADAKALLRRGMAQGKSGSTAEAQIVAAFFHPVAHGPDARIAQTGRLEARVAAGNQQQRGAPCRFFFRVIGRLRGIRGVAAERLA